MSRRIDSMNIIQNTLANDAPGVGIVETPEELSAIRDPGCAAVIWRRQSRSGFQGWIDALSADQLPRTRAVMQPDAVPAAVSRLCDQAGMPAGPERDWLIRDIPLLARRFASIVSAPYLRLRLDVVTTNACRKFHIDAVTARLICTYRGTGTQYGVSTDGADPERIFTVPTGAPIVLRGTLWPEEPPSGLLHRSPPIAGTGETRLLLVLDPVSGLNDDDD